MLTWQVKVFYTLLRVLAYCKLLPQKLDVITLRQRLDRLANWIKIDKKIRFEKLLVNNIPSEWILPNNYSNVIIFYLHGGAYCLGSTHTYRYLLAKLAQTTQAKIFAINYRLAPEHPFPAALEDAITAYQWLLKNNFSEQQIIIAGDSAGGGLAIATLIALRDRHIPLPRAAIALSPWLDLAMTGESIFINNNRDYLISPKLAKQAANLYLQTADSTNPLASPLYANLNQLPPIYIQVGSAEILLADSVRFAEKAKRSGVNIKLDIWQDMFHGWHFFTGFIPESANAILSIRNFIDQLQIKNQFNGI